MNINLLAVLIALIFFGILPFLGAIYTRTRWRRFRKSLIEASMVPVYPANSSGNQARRFFGSLDAIEDENIIWLSDGRHRVRVDLSTQHIFVLPGHDLNSEVLQRSDASPAYTRWKNLSSLPEGTRFFIYGMVDNSSLVPLFYSDPLCRMLVIVHDVESEQVLSRSIQTGRQRNEFWNSITPFSLLSGVMLELLLLLQVLQQSGEDFSMIFLVPLALLPGLILAPPGIFLYFLYRSQWRQGRNYRSQRDLLRLPLRYPGGVLPDGGSYEREICSPHRHEILNDPRFSLRNSVIQGGDQERLWCFYPRESNDPFAERVAIQGDPEVLAEQCHRKAVVHELLALVYFGLGVVINFFLVVILFLLYVF